MKTTIKIFATLIVLSAAGLAAQGQTTITFDDLTSNTGIDSIGGIPNGYQGLDWYNLYVAASDAYPGSNYPSAIVSGDYAAIDGYGTTPSTITGGPFLLDSAYLTAVWDPSDTVDVQGYLAGNLVFDTTVDVGSSASLTDFTSIDPTSIDTLDFTITGDPINDNFAVDNLAVTFVPEPASTGTLLLASAGALFARWRKAPAAP
jgi:hypothetical protein